MSDSTTGERKGREGRKEFFGLPAFASFAIFAFLFSSPAAAQQPPARFSLESVVAADEFGGESASNRPQLIFDVSLSVRVSDNWQVYVRPWFRMPRPSAPGGTVPDWDTELYQAGLRYERRGPIAVRVDAGQILSPIGLGIYDVRPGVNPTIVPHLSYLTPMPVFDPAAPRVSAVSSTYPLGAQVSLSTDLWDARAAVINVAPTRGYAIGGVTNPKSTPVFAAGGGVTPITGLRLGASFARGLYATADEITTPGTQGRMMTMAGAEGEWAFAGTRISGEILRTGFETAADTAVAYEWFVQGQQTLSPRWFAAARREGTSAPALVSGTSIGVRTDLEVFEATVGFRASREVTLRSSYYARRFYGSTDWANQVGVAVVWAQRWW